MEITISSPRSSVSSLGNDLEGNSNDAQPAVAAAGFSSSIDPETGNGALDGRSISMSRNTPHRCSVLATFTEYSIPLLGISIMVTGGLIRTYDVNTGEKIMYAGGAVLVMYMTYKVSTLAIKHFEQPEVSAT